MSADKDYLSLPLKTLLEDSAARSPTPGGGSIAAVVGALAASLGRMAINYTLPQSPQSGDRKRAVPEEHESRLRALLDELGRAVDMFGQLMREDMAAYERFAASRKAEPEERQRALATAVAVPMETLVLAGAVAARLDEIKAVVNPYLFSDLQTAAVLAYAAVQAACVNVRVNLKSLADRKEAERLDNQLDVLAGRAGRHRNAVLHYEPS